MNTSGSDSITNDNSGREYEVHDEKRGSRTFCQCDIDISIARSFANISKATVYSFDHWQSERVFMQEYFWRINPSIVVS